MFVGLVVGKIRENPREKLRQYLAALAIEFNDHVKRRYPDAEATIRLASMDGLSVLGRLPHDKEVIQEILKETWESADDWFQT